MRIPRVYIPQDLVTGASIGLQDNAANHLVRVLRLQTGKDIIVFNGKGGEYQALIETVTKKSVSIRIGEFNDVSRESGIEVHLLQGISRGERMDFTLQKAVELGVTTITPVVTERTVVKLDQARSEKRLQHWQGIIISACEQCGRNTVPDIHTISDFNTCLQRDIKGAGLLLDPTADISLTQLQGSPTVTLLIGPEGGLAEHERMAAYDKGFSGVRLGPRILRTETAALTALSALQTLWGDLR